MAIRSSHLRRRVDIVAIVSVFSLAFGIGAVASGQGKKTAKLPGKILGIATLEAERLAGKELPYGLVSVDPNSGEWNKLFDIPKGVGEPTISRDGRHCFFIYYNGTRRGVLMLDIGGEPGSVPKHVSDQTGAISCGPKGSELIISARDNSVFQQRFESQSKNRKRSSDDGILSVEFPPAGHWRVRLDDGREQKLDIPGEYQVEDWSPDGEWLVATTWSADDGDNTSSYGDLYLMRPDGSERRRLTNHKTGCSWPRFSPDGKQIAYSSSVNGENNGARYSAIRIIDISSHEDRELIGHQNEVEGDKVVGRYAWYYFPAWSPDNAWLAITCQQAANNIGRQDTALLLMSQDGTQIEELQLAQGASFLPGPRRVHWQ